MHDENDMITFMMLFVASVPFVLWTALKRRRENAPPFFPQPGNDAARDVWLGRHGRLFRRGAA